MSLSVTASTSSAQAVQALFQRADTDQNGGISLNELLSATSTTGADAGSIGKLFSSADTSGDGLISRSEMQTAFDRMSTDMKNTLIGVQADSSSSQASSDAGAGADMGASAAGDGGAGSGQGAGAASPQGGGGGGGGVSSKKSSSSDPADTNGDGIVTAAEQAAYDAKHPDLALAKKASEASSTSASNLLASANSSSAA